MVKKSTNKNRSFDLLGVASTIIYNFVCKINKFFNNKKNHNILKTIIRFMCALIIVALLKIPFFLVGKIGEVIINLFSLPASKLLGNIWFSVIEYAYLIFSFIAIFKIITDMSNKKEYNFEIKNSKHTINKLYYVIKQVLIVIIEIILIPLYLFCILLFVVLGMIFGLLTHGIYTFGSLLMIIGLLISVIFLLLYIHDFVYGNKKEVKHE